MVLNFLIVFPAKAGTQGPEIKAFAPPAPAADWFFARLFVCRSRPRMAVTAEIRTGRRRVISYLLSPLMRYEQEGMRER
jgi:hypothetical protein